MSVYSSGEWKVKSCGRRRPFNSWKLDDGWPLHLIEFSDNIVNTKCNIFFSVSFWNWPRTTQLLHRRRFARDSTWIEKFWMHLYWARRCVDWTIWHTTTFAMQFSIRYTQSLWTCNDEQWNIGCRRCWWQWKCWILLLCVAAVAVVLCN